MPLSRDEAVEVGKGMGLNERQMQFYLAQMGFKDEPVSADEPVVEAESPAAPRAPSRAAARRDAALAAPKAPAAPKVAAPVEEPTEAPKAAYDPNLLTPAPVEVQLAQEGIGAPDDLADPMAAAAYLLANTPDDKRAAVDRALRSVTPESVVSRARGLRASKQQAIANGTDGSK